MYIISPLTSQLRMVSRKVAIKSKGLLKVYKIIDLHDYLLMTLDTKLLRGLFEHERLKLAMIRTNQGNINNLAHLLACWYIERFEVEVEIYCSDDSFDKFK